MMDSSDCSVDRILDTGEFTLPSYGSLTHLKPSAPAVDNMSRYRSVPDHDDKPAHWPWFVWFILKLIGLYNCRPAVARRRLCLQCRHAAIERKCVVNGKGVPWYLCMETTDLEDEEGELEELTQFMISSVEADQGEGVNRPRVSDDRCVVCQCEWWDAQGKFRPYTDADIGVSRWNHYGSTVLSVIWQVLLIVFNMVHFFYYFITYWGNADQKVDLIIYSGFVLFVISIPTLCLVANVINMTPAWRKSCWKFSWSTALSVQYIVKRLQHLGLRERGLPYKAFLVVCVIWPLVNSVWRFILFYVIFEATDKFHINISLITCTVSMAIWGVFCYLVVLMRLSFQRQLQMELGFLWKHNGLLDRCRGRLAGFMEEFGSLGSLVSIWIMFTIAVATWAISTQIYYDYASFEGNYNMTVLTRPTTGIVNMTVLTHSMSTSMFATNKQLDCLIWSEITMFLILPLVAVGGLDLNRQWVQFKRRIGELRLGRKGYDAFCDKILAFCNEHPPVRNIETMTLLVSTLGLCLAVEFNDKEEFSLLHHAH